mmetsp:Transcript_100997/g.140349  ORF Transcript_100997/g.140349 Transcript_100997/m.140349 type:complete len:154 (+) Transcript_100997:213-674(+)
MSDPKRSEAIRAKMEARRKAREESGEAEAQRKAEEAKRKKKEETKKLASLLGGELDMLLKEEKDKKLVQEKLAAGESPVTATDYKLYQTLYPFKSDDPEDLCFEANEIIRVYDWEDEWFEGENQQGKRGYLPATYVREIKSKGGAKTLAGMPT